MKGGLRTLTIEERLRMTARANSNIGPGRKSGNKV